MRVNASHATHPEWLPNTLMENAICVTCPTVQFVDKTMSVTCVWQAMLLTGPFVWFSHAVLPVPVAGITCRWSTECAQQCVETESRSVYSNVTIATQSLGMDVLHHAGYKHVSRTVHVRGGIFRESTTHAAPSVETATQSVVNSVTMAIPWTMMDVHLRV